MSDKTETGDETESGKKKTLKLGGKGTLQLKKSVDGAAPARRSASGGRGGKQVVVERRRRRVVSKDTEAPAAASEDVASEDTPHLTESELAARARVLEQAEQERRAAPKPAVKDQPQEQPAAAEPEAEDAATAEAEVAQEVPAEMAADAPVAGAEQPAVPEAAAEAAPDTETTARAKEPVSPEGGPKIIPRPKPAPKPAAKPAARQGRGARPAGKPEPDMPPPEEAVTARRKALPERDRDNERTRPTPRTSDGERRRGKLTVARALADDLDERQRSLAAMRRAREKQKAAARQPQEPREKVVQDVVVPDVITVGELANRMAERSADVIRSLMKMGMMATINQEIDQDTAELLVEEFGHKIRRVSESDVEIGLTGSDDDPATLKARPPVVTVMGHVDHGKTSLLDALREADVVAGEAGGITQHIGAYQVTLPSGDVVTFLDTPGHAAFTAMRARGAQVTDIVVLVVAADDSIMPQTIEAIQHAKAADVPIVVAINKIDKPDANPDKVRQELLQHDVQVEGMGGDTLCVEVSATQKMGLDKLLEALHLQAELMELKANPDRPAEGAVVEATMEKGRGSVATLLVTRGTLRVGDIFVAGAEWGRVRALIDEHGQQLDEAGPSRPCEVLGLNGTPEAGDDFIVVENEARAREVTEYRQRERKKAAHIPAARPATLEAMMGELKSRERAELPLLVKADVQGSAEAISAAVENLSTDEVTARVIFAGVGAISESDVNLAKAAGAPILAFNVRPNSQAKKLAEEERVETRFYSVIYDLVDDVKGVMSGMLAPEIRETALGTAEVREVFSAGKVGKAAGCLVMEGVMKAGAKVRLVRDSVVVNDGKILSLRRFKDEVREVNAGTECGITLENFSDIKAGDVIEAYEVEEVARSL